VDHHGSPRLEKFYHYRSNSKDKDCNVESQTLVSNLVSSLKKNSQMSARWSFYKVHSVASCLSIEYASDTAKISDLIFDKHSVVVEYFGLQGVI